MTLTEQIDNLITEKLIQRIAEIEKAPQTTVHNYGRYMTLMVYAQKDDKTDARVMALALMKAGANKPGVIKALETLNFGL